MKPLSGYMLWFKDARKTIKGKNFAEIGKKAGEMWKSMSADKKKPFADRAQDAQKKYAAYIATSKGAAALKAYKDGIAKAKAPLIAKDGKLKAKKAAKSAKKRKSKSHKGCEDQKGGSGKSGGKSKKGCEGKSKKGSKSKKSGSKEGSKSKKGGSSKSKKGGESKQKGSEKGKAIEEDK